MPRSVPNYLTTAADGSVGAEFTGKIVARGIELPDGLTDISQVKWVRETDGAYVADILADEATPTQRTARWRIESPDASKDASLLLHGNDTGSRVIASLNAGTFNKPLISDSGAANSWISGWVQLLSNNLDVRLEFGACNGAGAVTFPGSGGWTCARPAVGVYNITTIPVGRRGFGACYVRGAGAFLMSRAIDTGVGMQYQFTTPGGVFTDTAFGFLFVCIP